MGPSKSGRSRCVGGKMNFFDLNGNWENRSIAARPHPFCCIYHSRRTKWISVGETISIDFPEIWNSPAIVISREKTDSIGMSLLLFIFASIYFSLASARCSPSRTHATFSHINTRQLPTHPEAGKRNDWNEYERCTQCRSRAHIRTSAKDTRQWELRYSQWRAKVKQ